MSWAVIKTIELGVEKKRLVNLEHVVKIRRTEETDGEYHVKHSGRAVVFMSQFDVVPENFEQHAIVGEVIDVKNNILECDINRL